MSEIENENSLKDYSFTNHSISVLIIDFEEEGRLKAAKSLKESAVPISLVLSATLEEAKMQLMQTSFDIVFIHYQTNMAVYRSSNLEQDFEPFVQKVVLMVDDFSHDMVRLALKIKAFDLINFPPTTADIQAILFRYIEAKTKEENNGNEKSTARQSKLLEQGIQFKTAHGYFYTDPENILYVQAAKHYSTIVFALNDKELLVHESVSAIENKLRGTALKRYGRCHIINTNRIARLQFRNHSVIFMGEGFSKELKISKSAIQALFKEIK